MESTADPQIINKGDGSFHPFEEQLVARALSAINVNGHPMNVSVNVYILPFPRYGSLASSASGTDIFLSPGVYEMSGSACAYSVAHEMGHIVQFALLPEHGEGWNEYLGRRGIYGDPLYSESAVHQNRPSEIFAEDFRFLFGGEEACYAGTIENSSLPLPDAIPGLAEFIASLVSSEPSASTDSPAASPLNVLNYPNPFNPVTTIRVLASGGGAERDADVTVYRVDGSLVKRVFQGCISGDEITMQWDGTDEGGREVPSGVYLSVARWGEARATGKMILMR